ncbi:branched-chain amino acid transport system substrate-binding protein [Actinocorallia herbida]|uniref:Branched-chain amino acid transport system substrate-binding protein n=1 Tax=Actinocorallia herbida TaxID=58109 RepID=A0A3N1CVB8_9ACTN|nr:ABC transporter substrate-binding protein [Actinocorallia herbida]ROO85242.1 branched-chain amino acid transport system substrate-binding protein [Actinocorallia herbida]
MRSSLKIIASVAVLAVTAAGCSGKSAADKPAIKIGLAGPMSGAFAVLGISQQNSLQVEIDRINEAGGIDGSQVELVVRDTVLDPAKAVSAANEFAGDEQVKLVVGPSLTSFYEATKGVYEQARKVNCQPGVSTGDFSGLGYGFRSQDPTGLDLQKLMQHYKDAGVRSFGLIYENDDSGKNLDAMLKEAAGQYGIEYLGFQQTRADDQSHKVYVEKLKDADLIFLSSNVGGAKTMAAAAEVGYDGELAGAGSGMQNITFIEAAGDYAQGAIFPAPNYQYPMRDRAAWRPGYRKHIEAVEAAYGKNVGPESGATSPKGTAMAADCVYAWSQAVKAAGGADDTAKVAAAIESLDLSADETPSGNSIAPGSSHEFYSLEDIHLYEWQKDAQGWFVKDVEAGS